MKIFGVGLARTGTTSLCRALEVLGYTYTHNPRNLAKVEWFDAAADEPVAASYKALDKLYPGSRFILTLRDLDDWAASMAWLWGEFVNLRNHPKAVRDRAREIRKSIYGTTEPDIAMLKEGHHRHIEGVRGYFSQRPGDLLEMRICEGEGWERLCAFLGKPKPDTAFPSANSRAEMLERRRCQNAERRKT